MGALLRWSTLLFLASCATAKPQKRAGNEYDYVIVGGGLTGLVTAARLSENSSGEGNRCQKTGKIAYSVAQFLCWCWNMESLIEATRPQSRIMAQQYSMTRCELFHQIQSHIWATRSTPY